MKIIETGLKGCFLLHPIVHRDIRGSFVKIFQKEHFVDMGFETEFSEEYFSISKQGVVRGMHFQIPPYDHSKIVYCVYGKVFDAVVDLRASSKTYGKYLTFELDSDEARMLYIPPGLAHGFYTISESSSMAYKVTALHSSKHDTGILWNSLGIPWPNENPIISERDGKLIKFKNFNSPFN